MRLEIGERLRVGLLARRMRVGDEDQAVGTLQDGAPREPVVDLAGHRVEVEAGEEAVHLAEVDGQEVEEERPLVIGGDRDHAAAPIGRQAIVQEAEVGRLPAQPGAVIDDLEVDLARAVVDERHGPPGSLRDRANPTAFRT